MARYDQEPDEPAATAAAPAGGKRRYDQEDDPTPDDRTKQIAREQSSMGWPAYIGQGVGDAIAGVNQAFYGGLAPRILAPYKVLTGEAPDYSTAVEQGLANQRARAERSPVATAGGNLAGGVAQAVTGAKALPIGASISSGLSNLPARLGQIIGYGTEGAAYGAANAAGNTYTGNPADYAAAAVKGAGPGAVIGGVAGALVPKSAVAPRAGDPRTGEFLRQPSEAELKAISDRGYQVLSRMKVTYPEGFKHAILDNARAQMQAQNIPPEMARSVYGILDRARAQGGSISPAQVDAIRQQLNGFVNNPNAVGAEKAGLAANILRNALDDMIQHGAQYSSNPGIGARAAQVVSEARGNAAARFRSMQLTDPLVNAEMKAATGGAPVGEQLVAKGNQILTTKRGEQPKTRGWIDEERDRVAAAITPTLAERAANAAAKLPLGQIGAWAGGLTLGTAGGVGGLAHGVPGVASGGLAGAGVGATAGGLAGSAAQAGLRGFSANAIRQRWEDAAAAMRGRSPAYEARLRGAVPIAGPGMGSAGQAVQGGARYELGTPYDDGRDALAWQYMNTFGQ